MIFSDLLQVHDLIRMLKLYLEECHTRVINLNRSQFLTRYLLSHLEYNTHKTSKEIECYSDISRLNSSHFNGENLNAIF